MLDSGFMPPLHPRSSDRNVHGEVCAVATREKTMVLLFMDENYCLHYLLILMHLPVAHKAITSLLQLNTSEICWITFKGGILDMDARWIAVHMLLRNAYGVRTHELHLIIIVLLYVCDLSIAQL